MTVEIKIGKNAKKENVTNFSLQVLEDITSGAVKQRFNLFHCWYDSRSSEGHVQ